jgi:hypothetical protein
MQLKTREKDHLIATQNFMQTISVIYHTRIFYYDMQFLFKKCFLECKKNVEVPLQQNATTCDIISNPLLPK